MALDLDSSQVVTFFFFACLALECCACSALRVSRLLLALRTCLLTLLPLARPLEAGDELSFFSGTSGVFTQYNVRLLLALLACFLTLLTLAGPLEAVDELSFFSGVFTHFSDTQPLVARQLVQ